MKTAFWKTDWFLLNLTSKDVKVSLGESVTVGGKRIRTDELAQMYTYFYKDRDGRPAFPIDSFFDVYTGKIPASKYADKIVLIGGTAAGVGASLVTPISTQMNPVTTLAHSVSSILQEHYYMATFDAKFRDIQERLNRAKQLSETIISAAARTNASTMVLQGGGQEKPMLGRYQVDKELGKGAMGVVYAGKDPKIGRVVAIKPANIMFEPESDTVKVTDFGIARITDSSKTKTGMVLGTPSYMSPEQLAGRKIDGRSDLFSLGVTLYQMLSGQLPFQGESMTQLMFAIANQPHPPIRQYNAALPAWIDLLIDKALAKNFEQRFQNGAEFAEALRKARRALAPVVAA